MPSTACRRAAAWETWNYNNAGGFGKRVLGETWLTHWGRHKIEATRGAIEDAQRKHPVLRDVSDLFGETDVYEAYPPADATDSGTRCGPEDADAGRRAGRLQQAAGDRQAGAGRQRSGDARRVDADLSQRQRQDQSHPDVDDGSATDLENEGLRRLIVNGVYWGLGMDVPAKADVRYVDEYQPSFYGFDGFRKGLHASDFEIGKKVPGEPLPRPAKTAR